MRFHDQDYDLGTHQTVIRTDPFGAIVELRFNAHLAGILDIAPENMVAYYRAYRQLMKLIRTPIIILKSNFKQAKWPCLITAECCMAGGPDRTGRRRRRGCYVDRGEWDSKIQYSLGRTRKPHDLPIPTQPRPVTSSTGNTSKTAPVL